MSNSPLQTEQELEQMKRFILIPVLLDVLERDAQTLQSLQLKMPHIYILALQNIQQEALQWQRRLKTRLKSAGIHLLMTKRTTESLQAHYRCRGYEHKMELLWNLVKAEIETMLYRAFHVDQYQGNK